jgi:hypothetical protein
MSTAILSDGSVIVRLAWQTVHLDVRTRAIHLRAPTDEGLGDILESFPQVAIDRVRILRGPEEKHFLMLELGSGRSLSLGHAVSHDGAMSTARVVADLTRCKVEVSEGTVSTLPGPSAAFSRSDTFQHALALIEAELDPFDEPTHEVAGWEPPPTPPPRTRTSEVEAKTEIVIRDDL